MVWFWWLSLASTSWASAWGEEESLPPPDVLEAAAPFVPLPLPVPPVLPTALERAREAVAQPLPKPLPTTNKALSTLSPAMRARVADLRHRYLHIQNVAEFKATLEAVQLLADDLAIAFQPAFEASYDRAKVQLDSLTPYLPGLRWDCVGECTRLVFTADIELWLPMAAATPSLDDDLFLQYVALSYSDLAVRAWPNWNVRTWDYGGRSTFGSGTHHQIIRMAQLLLLSDSPFQRDIIEIRREVMEDIFDKETYFPYQTPEGETRPFAELRAEAEAILALDLLTDDERSKLQARIRERFAQVVK